MEFLPLFLTMIAIIKITLHPPCCSKLQGNSFYSQFSREWFSRKKKKKKKVETEIRNDRDSEVCKRRMKLPLQSDTKDGCVSLANRHGANFPDISGDDYGPDIGYEHFHQD